MPKIRKKAKLLSSGQYREKSGTLTRSIKNIDKKDNDFKSFYIKDIKDVNIKKTVGIDPYNDDNTPLFVLKSVNPAFQVEDSYKLDNKILNTPNTYDTSLNLVSKVVKKRQYDQAIKANYADLDEILFPFNDYSLADKEDLKNSKQKIDFKLNFSDPCRLSFNKDSSANEQVTINGQSYNTHNGNIVYYDFFNNKWEYLGDITTNYSSSINDFINAPIAFNSVKTAKTTPIKNQTVGVPITTFGFPYEKRFQAMNRHCLNIGDYIDDLFVLEDIKIKINCTNLSASENFEVLNSLNFFVLNQRQNLNGDSFANLGFDEQGVKYYSTVANVVDTLPTTHDIGGIIPDNLNVYSSITNSGETNESTLIYTGSQNTSDILYEEGLSSQRELVSYLSIVNYSSGSITDKKIDYQSIKDNADFFFEDTSSPSSGAVSECVYTDKEIIVSGSVSTPVYHEKIERLGKFNIYPEVDYETRTGTHYKSERSISSVFYKDNNTTTTTDDDNVDITISKTSKKSNPYILHPKDKLIFGFSFNPSFNVFNVDPANLHSRDISILKESIEISLIGRYYRDDKATSDSRKNYYQNKNIEFSSRMILDEIGISNIHLNKGAYYDRVLELLGGLIPNIDSGAGVSTISPGSIFTPNSVLNYKKLSDENQQTVDSIGISTPLNDPNGLKKIYNSFYFNYLRFGQPLNKLYYTTFNAYRDSLDNNRKVYAINKRSKNKYFEDITPTLAYNQDPNCKISGPSPFVD
jgi:hypothetical protein